MKQAVISGISPGFKKTFRLLPSAGKTSIHSIKCSSVIGCGMLPIFTLLPSMTGLCFSVPSSSIFSS